MIYLGKKSLSFGALRPFGALQKGFIGPIGDDLPSLIPIVVALMLFFSIFSLTLNTYYTKNSVFDQQVEMTSVARELKGDSLILNVKQFQDRCTQVTSKRNPYSFMAAIYSAENTPDKFTDDFITSTIGGPGEAAVPSPNFLSEKVDDADQFYFCGYKKIGGNEFASAATGKDPQKKYSFRAYPVAIQTIITQNINGVPVPELVIIPGVMVMVIWGAG